MATNIIGSVTTYVGDEIPGFKGRRVQVFGVMRGALRPDVNVDADDYCITDDEILAFLGGVGPLDRVDVTDIWIRPRQLRALRREDDGPRPLQAPYAAT